MCSWRDQRKNTRAIRTFLSQRCTTGQSGISDSTTVHLQTLIVKEFSRDYVSKLKRSPTEIWTHTDSRAWVISLRTSASIVDEKVDPHPPPYGRGFSFWWSYHLQLSGRWPKPRQKSQRPRRRQLWSRFRFLVSGNMLDLVVFDCPLLPQYLSINMSVHIFHFHVVIFFRTTALVSFDWCDLKYEELIFQ